MFEKFTPQQLRDAIEIEMQKTDSVQLAANIAIKRLEKDPEYYEKKKKRVIKSIMRGLGLL
jgi:hypothetical protein